MSTQRNDILKLIAAIFMVFDHWAALFHPYNFLLRIPGRIVFPIFAYYAAIGICRTSNPHKYLFRLCLAAIITQPIYFLLFPYSLNIIFTILYGVICVYLYDNNILWKKIFSMCLLVISIFLPMLDYGYYGVFCIFLFYLTKEQKPLTVVTQAILVTLYCLSTTIWIQAYCLFSLPLIYCPWKVSIQLPKYFFYVFYPAHLAILLFILYLV